MGSEDSAEMATVQSEIELKANETPRTIEELHAELERTKSALKKANSESANHRHKAKELDDLKLKAEQEKLAEVEKLQKELQDVQQKYAQSQVQQQEQRVQISVQRVCSSLGIIDAEVAEKLLNWSDIEWDDTGLPQNIEALLKEVVKNKPYLVSSQQQQQVRYSATNPSRSSATYSDVDDILGKMQRGKLTPAEYDALSPQMKTKLQGMLTSRR